MVSDRDSDIDDGAVVIEKIYNDLKERYRVLKSRLREMQSKPECPQQQYGTIIEEHFQALHVPLARIGEKMDQSRQVSQQRSTTAQPRPKKAKFSTDEENVTINDTVTMPLYQRLHCHRER